MFALGVLSLVQILFLPGFLLIKLLRIKPLSWMAVLVLSFALSLIANCCVVFPMAAAGVYTRVVLVALMVLELLLLILVIVQRSAQSEAPRPSAGAGPGQSATSIGKNPVVVVVLILVSYWFLLVLVQNIGTVFTTSDAVVSWNPWARAWAANYVPQATWRYPQLLPANWSVSYVLMGTELQFFPKAIMPLFSLFLLLLLLDLALRTRDMQYVWALAVAGILVRVLLGRLVPAGYTECAVAFFALASVYCLIHPEARADSRSGKRALVLGAALAGGCALTKQAGLFMVVAYPVLAYVLRLRGAPIPRGERLRLVVLCLACLLVIVAPWYVYKEIQIARGEHSTVLVQLVTVKHEGRDLFQRLATGIGAIRDELGGTAGSAALLAALVLGLRDKRSFWIFCIAVVPYTLLWGFFFSYSVRNYALALPLLALVAGSGVARAQRFLEKGAGFIRTKAAQRPSLKASWVWVAAAIVLAGVGLVVGSIVLTGDRMLRRQEALQRLVGRAGLNAMLYEYVERCPLEGKIITDYYLLGHLPGLAQYKAKQDVAGIPEEEYEAFLTRAAEDGKVYLLFSSVVYPRLFEAVKNACATGHCEVVGKCGSWHLVKVQPAPTPSGPAQPDENAEMPAE